MTEEINTIKSLKTVAAWDRLEELIPALSQHKMKTGSPKVCRDIAVEAYQQGVQDVLNSKFSASRR